MKKIVTLILALALVASVAIGMAACSDVVEATEIEIPAYDPMYAGLEIPSTFRIGLICLHDESSTYDLNFINSAKAAVRALGMNDSQLIIKTGIAEEGSACYDTAKDLVDQDCTVIFADSFGHEAGMIKAAKEFTNVEFCHATGTKAHTENLPNFHNAFASIYEGRYLAGIAAGMKLNEMIAAGKITADKALMGYVGAYTYAEVISGYTSFYLGAKSVCPTVKMKVQFTGSWYDVTAEKTAAENLISQGCVLISQHADSMGAPSACEKAGVPNISYNGSTISACPETFIISSRIDWAPYFKGIIAIGSGAAGESAKIPADFVGTIENGAVALTGLNGDVAAEGTLKAILKARDAIVAGTLKIFDTSTFTVTVRPASGDDFGLNTSATVDSNGKLTGYLADVDDTVGADGKSDYVHETEAVANGAFQESKFRSAPYFDLTIDGITLLNSVY